MYIIVSYILRIFFKSFRFFLTCIFSLITHSFICLGLGQNSFVWGSVNLLVWDFLTVADKLFLKDLRGPEKYLENVYSSGPLKDQLESAPATTGLVAAYILAVRW